MILDYLIKQFADSLEQLIDVQKSAEPRLIPFNVSSVLEYSSAAPLPAGVPSCFLRFDMSRRNAPFPVALRSAR